MIYDWRKDRSLPPSRVLDAQTGEVIPACYRVDTESERYRWLRHEGKFVIDVDTKHVATVHEVRPSSVEFLTLEGEWVPAKEVQPLVIEQ